MLHNSFWSSLNSFELDLLKDLPCELIGKTQKIGALLIPAKILHSTPIPGKVGFNVGFQPCPLHAEFSPHSRDRDNEIPKFLVIMH